MPGASALVIRDRHAVQPVNPIEERINIESERLFAETFHAVSKNFKSMFKRLFGDKATADLILQDESDPLECGIEVIAKPPGKKLQSISLMSGILNYDT